MAKKAAILISSVPLKIDLQFDAIYRRMKVGAISHPGSGEIAYLVGVGSPLGGGVYATITCLPNLQIITYTNKLRADP